MIDGAIQYETGHSSADWVEAGLSGMEEKILNNTNSTTSRITVSEGGAVTDCSLGASCLIDS